MLHMAADERVAEGPVKQAVAWQVEDAQAHQVDPLGFPIRGEHGQANVLWKKEARTLWHLLPPLPLPGRPNCIFGHVSTQMCWPG